MNIRVEKLRSKLSELSLDAILISQTENRRYLSGFTGSAGYLLISPDRAIVTTDFRYLEQAGLEAPDFQVIRITGEPPKWFPDLAATLGGQKIGFESTDISFAMYQALTQALAQSQAAKHLRLIPVQQVVEPIRAVKEESELKLMQQAAALSDAAFEHVAATIAPGVTEKQIAWALEKYLKENGSGPLPFDIIVGSGPNSALPHIRPGDRPVQEGEPIVIDVGARWKGYCSDLTRTIWLGKPDKKLTQVYDIVLAAQLTAMATMATSMTGEQADRLARTVIEQAGYGEAFGHSLGHGVGLVPHEFPRLGSGSTDVLANGMVLTDEPGIYITGWGGVRIEDMVVMENGRPKSLSHARKQS
ncbi:MAG: Xaa-Pro peptidase family protein [Dehalococcoidia bacterium]|nr:Xaa-Pro peptidase family protein [Dehalococcoidia bacterium]